MFGFGKRAYTVEELRAQSEEGEFRATRKEANKIINGIHGQIREATKKGETSIYLYSSYKPVRFRGVYALVAAWCDEHGIPVRLGKDSGSSMYAEWGE